MEVSYKSTDERIRDYLKRSGTPKPPKKEEVYENSKGFISYKVDGDCLVISHCYGDGRYWDEVAINLAKELGCHKVLFPTKRNPKAWERLLGYKVEGWILSKEVE